MYKELEKYRNVPIVTDPIKAEYEVFKQEAVEHYKDKWMIPFPPSRLHYALVGL